MKKFAYTKLDEMDTQNYFKTEGGATMNYEYEIPISRFPDPAAVAKEYEILATISCPVCNKKSLRMKRQYALPPEPESNWPYPISGDKLECECEHCGHTVEVTFRFTISEK